MFDGVIVTDGGFAWLYPAPFTTGVKPITAPYAEMGPAITALPLTAILISPPSAAIPERVTVDLPEFTI